MSDWSGGYPTSSAYLDAIQPEISPFRWRTSLLAARRMPPDHAGAFRLLELGCGSAQTLIALAACYPKADFVGYDFMPEHVVRARMMIDAVELSNIRVEEASFADLARLRPEEPFDYAALHGVWTWVSEAVREEITDILAGWLVPGAVTYLGYNAAAGWLEAEPLRRIFRELPQGTGKGRFDAARAAIEAWLAAKDAPGAERIWNKLKDQPDAYLAHELAPEHGTAIWFGDLAEALGRAKLGYACPAILAEQFDALFLPEDQAGFLRQAVAGGWGEIARDLVHKRTFRSDLFHRGAPKLSVGEMIGLLGAMPVARWSPAYQLGDFRPALGAPLRGVDPALLQKIDAALAQGPAKMADCMAALELESDVQAVQTCLVALLTGELIELRDTVETESATASAARFNSMAKRLLLSGSPLQGLASPALGGPVPVSQRLQRVAFGLESGEPEITGALDTLGVMGV